MASDRKKAFLQGFEAGLRAAGEEAINLASRGYSSAERGVGARPSAATRRAIRLTPRWFVASFVFAITPSSVEEYPREASLIASFHAALRPASNP